MKSITICASSSFYKDVINIQSTLQKAGLVVFIPATAKKMKESGDYNVDNYKTWFGNASDYSKKAMLISDHFDEIEKGDITLVLNYEKHGIQNYIGGNVLMEMAIAFYLKKPIYILNDVPAESPFLEEILGMQPITLHGDLQPLITKSL